MAGIQASDDTAMFEVAAVVDGAGRLTAACAERARAVIDGHGLVILTGLLSEAEADAGLAVIAATIDDPERARSAFASETDNRYRRRDFCALPSAPPVLGLAATLCRRLEGVIGEYCGRSRSLLEITTLTSYLGSSHQYVHRDPAGVISLIAAVEDVSAEQGGTVFVPGTHRYGGSEAGHGGGVEGLTALFRLRCNLRILRYNLAKLWGMRRGQGAPLAPGEFRDRVFSTRWDQHQPNLLRFLSGKNAEFSVAMLGPRTLWRMVRRRAALDGAFRLVRTAPRKGSVILYRSDLLHAGPDNRSPHPRRVLSLSIARDVVAAKFWADGYSPHPTLVAAPLRFGDLLAYRGEAVAPRLSAVG